MAGTLIMKTVGPPPTGGVEPEVLVVMAEVVLDCELVADVIRTCSRILFWSDSFISLKFTNLRRRLLPRFVRASARRRRKASYSASAFFEIPGSVAFGHKTFLFFIHG